MNLFGEKIVEEKEQDLFSTGMYQKDPNMKCALHSFLTILKPSS